ncbi:unnamed protein product [Onchocerca flexuosa]|uniref:Ovule protein n=1 Tax=Onchocerca flexuosa TaxID=387005 RepID=A0A183I737_9BILA|nr:unnamed protein product [Onchocerca flexuosa]
MGYSMTFTRVCTVQLPLKFALQYITVQCPFKHKYEIHRQTHSYQIYKTYRERRRTQIYKQLQLNDLVTDISFQLSLNTVRYSAPMAQYIFLQYSNCVIHGESS